MDTPILPGVTELTAPYWEAAARGDLVLQRCTSCRRYVHLPEFRCPFCRGTDLGFEPVDGRGVVDAVTVVHRALVPGAQPPYCLAWVALDAQEGLRLFGTVVDDTAPAVGAPVQVDFAPLPGFGALPVFRPL